MAVCSGASFEQIWRVKSRPWGVSQIVFLAVGALAKGSRTVEVCHGYQFTSVGRAGAPGVVRTPEVTLAQT